MKKFFTMVAVAATVMFASCGMGTGTTTTQNNNNANLLGAVLGGVASSATGTATAGANLATAGLNLLSTLLGGNAINTNSIVGTWRYTQPQVTFESTSILGNIGGELAGNKVEQILGSQLQKIGLKEGVSTFTFNKDNTMSASLNGKTANGTYTLNGTTLTMTGALGVASLSCTVSIQGNNLHMLFDATSLFKAITNLGGSGSSISSLLSSFNGMKLGWSMAK